MALNIVIIDKSKTIKSLNIKKFVENDLYKKCGFKSDDSFGLQTTWKIKMPDNQRYMVNVFAKTTGRSNSINPYDFPPPIDTNLFYGSVALVAKLKWNGVYKYTDLTGELWNAMYTQMFGGFEDISQTEKEDDKEEDELDKIPIELKTKEGYLKDGFVVDDDELTEDIYDYTYVT